MVQKRTAFLVARRKSLPIIMIAASTADRAAEANRNRRALRLENKPPDDEGCSGGEVLARYEHGVMLFLLLLIVTIVALLVWLGAYLIAV